MGNRKKRLCGFTFTEILVSIFIIFAGFFVIISVLKLSALHATQSRHAIVARLIADSLIEEVTAHTYGEPAPPSWTEPHYIISVFQGRKLNVKFERKIEYQNGSFVGNTEGDTDELLIIIKWAEGTGLHSRSVEKTYKERLRVGRSKL